MGDTTKNTTTRIYVACLAAYNSGYLHGSWIDANQDEDAIRAEIGLMLKGSPVADAEEYAIYDYEGFEGILISEYAGISAAATLAAFVVEHGALGAAVLDHFGGDLKEATDALTDRYHGVFESLANYIQEVTEETTEIPQSLRYYIDWQAMARDADMNGDLFTVETSRDEIHVFVGG
jgi:antirestriction protein